MLRTFEKPALSTAAQLDLLEQRGLAIPDRGHALAALEKIGYYRLSAYTFPFEERGDRRTHRFKQGANFNEVLTAYQFDRAIRLATLGALEHVEVAVRAAVSDVMATSRGPHWFLDLGCFVTSQAHAKTIEVIEKAIHADPDEENLRSVAIRHYFSNYHTPTLPPCWMVAEELSFGQTSTIFKVLSLGHQKAIAAVFGVHHTILASWFHSLSYTRNVCAHHGRLWNRTFTLRPKISNVIDPFLARRQGQVQNDRYYAQAVVLTFLSRRTGEQAEYVRRLKRLLETYPSAARTMGFPETWTDMTLWADR